MSAGLLRASGTRTQALQPALLRLPHVHARTCAVYSVSVTCVLLCSCVRSDTGQTKSASVSVAHLCVSASPLHTHSLPNNKHTFTHKQVHPCLLQVLCQCSTGLPRVWARRRRPAARRHLSRCVSLCFPCCCLVCRLLPLYADVCLFDSACCTGAFAGLVERFLAAHASDGAGLLEAQVLCVFVRLCVALSTCLCLIELLAV